MKKWKKIQKSLIRKWRQTLCDWFGHQPVKHPYQNLSFGEAHYRLLEAGKCVRRESWIGDKFVVKQIDSDISAEIVPKMQSLPDSAKELIGKTADKDIHYRNQCLVIKQFPSSSVATNYVPDWNDMFAKDWMVL